MEFFKSFYFPFSSGQFLEETTQTKHFRHLQVWGWSTYCQLGRLLWKAGGKTWHLFGDEGKEKGSMGSTSDLCLRGEEQLPLSAFGFLSCGNWPLFSYSEIPAEVSKECCVLLICKCSLSYLQGLIWNCVRMQDKAWMLLYAVTSLHPSVFLVSACSSRQRCSLEQTPLDCKGDSDFVLFCLWFWGRRSLCLGCTYYCSAYILCLWFTLFLRVRVNGNRACRRAWQGLDKGRRVMKGWGDFHSQNDSEDR